MKNRANGMIFVIAVYILAVCLIMFSVSGPLYGTRRFDGAFLSESAEADLLKKEAAYTAEADTLLVFDSGENESYELKDDLLFIVKDMKMGADAVDIAGGGALPAENYSNVIVDVSDLSRLDAYYETIVQRIADGGHVLFIRPPHISKAASNWADVLGIRTLTAENAVITAFRPKKSYMIGGGENYSLNSEAPSATEAELYGDVNILATDDTGKVPIIWEKREKDGQVVVLNFPYFSRAVRGIYATAVATLGDCSVYPVINASTYFLDDFPAPISDRRDDKLEAEYGLTYDRFLSDIWWPDVTALAKKHDFSYSGMIIENYSDTTDGSLTRNRDTDTYSYYGNMLLATGGELGIHGYNHQPLCLSDVDYGDDFSYNTWSSEEAMDASLTEVTGFAKELYPDTDFTCYVPPSNILSPQARELIGQNKDLGIRMIASTYVGEGYTYGQDFGIGDDGIIEAPRITSGEENSSFQKLLAMSELNYHFVNTHFMHPDDILDNDRTGDLTWEDCRENLDAYMTWVDDVAPGLRHLTASGLGGAVQRFAVAVPAVTEGENGIDIDVKNYVDTAYVFLRINNGREPSDVSGGKITPLTDSLYLVECDSTHVHVEFR